MKLSVVPRVNPREFSFIARNSVEILFVPDTFGDDVTRPANNSFNLCIYFVQGNKKSKHIFDRCELPIILINSED